MNLSKDFLEDFIRKEVYHILSGSQSTQGTSRGNGDGRKNSQTDMYTMLGKMMWNQKSQESQWGGPGQW